MEAVYITDVAPRDGLQNQAVLLATADKLEFVRLLATAGIASIEAASFVSPKAVPQMADADALLPLVSSLLPRLRISVLVPNQRGLARAHAAGAREVAVVLSATETMNRRNINMDLATATQVSVDTIREARALGMRTRAYLAVAVECPYEGLTPIDTTVRLADCLKAAGPDEIVIADTIGAASPAQIKQLLRELESVLPRDVTGMHFHDTRGMGVANAWAALEEGVRRFDASAGGIGGCPFAPGAAGNVATEDLALMAQQAGFETGIDLQSLLRSIEFAEEKLQQALGGRVARWLRHRKTAAAT